MKTQFELQNTYHDINRSVVLNQVITNLENLDYFTKDIYSKINQSLSEKKDKLENIKSRIVRASNIIKIIEKIPNGLTIKSSKYYPIKNQDFSNISYPSFMDDEVNSFQDVKVVKTVKENILNTRPVNTPEILGQLQNGSIEDLKICEDLFRCMNEYKNISNEINLTTKQFTDSDKITNTTKEFVDCFDFFNKSQVLGLNQGKTSSRLESLRNEGKVEIQKKVAKKKIELDLAPQSITNQDQMTKYVEERNYLIRGNVEDVKFEFKENIGLLGVTELVEQQPEISNENYFKPNPIQNNDNIVEEKKNSTMRLNIQDIGEFDDIITPIEVIQKSNLRKKTITDSKKKESSNNLINQSENIVYQSQFLENTPNKQNSNVNVSKIQDKINTVSVEVNEGKKIEVVQVKNIEVTQQKQTQNLNVPKVPISVPPVPIVPAADVVLTRSKSVVAPPNNDKRNSLLEQIRNVDPTAMLKKIPKEEKKQVKMESGEQKIHRSGTVTANSAESELKAAILRRFQKLNSLNNNSDKEESD